MLEQLDDDTNVAATEQPLAWACRLVLHGRPGRDTGRLHTERMNTELGPTLVTTPEQTVLDLACRPDLDAEEEARDAVCILIARADVGLLDELAMAQRARTPLRRARDWARTPNR